MGTTVQAVDAEVDAVQKRLAELREKSKRAITAGGDIEEGDELEDVRLRARLSRLGEARAELVAAEEREHAIRVKEQHLEMVAANRDRFDEADGRRVAAMERARALFTQGVAALQEGLAAAEELRVITEAAGRFVGADARGYEVPRDLVSPNREFAASRLLAAALQPLVSPGGTFGTLRHLHLEPGDPRPGAAWAKPMRRDIFAPIDREAERLEVQLADERRAHERKSAA